MPSTWSFTFSWAAVASDAVTWLQVGHASGFRVWQCILLAAITLLIIAIALRTLLAMTRRRLLPPSPVQTPAPVAAALV